MGLHLDAVNKSAKIIVIGLQGGDIEGYLNQDISLSGATDWQMPEGSASQQKFSETVNNIKTVTNRFGGNAAQTQYKNIIGTLMQWQGLYHNPPISICSHESWRGCSVPGKDSDGFTLSRDLR